jgi:hypothetical protein
MKPRQRKIVIRLLTDEARRLYLQLMRDNHPDKFPPEQRDKQTRITQRINQMYDEAIRR